LSCSNILGYIVEISFILVKGNGDIVLIRELEITKECIYDVDCWFKHLLHFDDGLVTAVVILLLNALMSRIWDVPSNIP
jgi:hypothetical protein